MRVPPKQVAGSRLVRLTTMVAALSLVFCGLLGDLRADPFTKHFDDLWSELDLRDAALPTENLSRAERRERSVLNRSFDLLAADPAGLAGDLKIARKLSLVFQRAYADDAEITSLLDAVLDALDADTAKHRLNVRGSLDGLEPNRVRDKAAALLDKADAASRKAVGARTAAARAAALRRSERLAAAAARKVAKGKPRTGDPVTDTHFSVLIDGELHDVASDSVTVTYTPAHDSVPASLIVRASTFGDPLANLVTLTVTGSIGAGTTFDLLDSGATLSRTRQTYRATSGQLQITNFDLVAGTAAATFAFEAARADGATLSLTEGSFSTLGLVIAE